jgi:glycine/D-amino acid oxidase-like deaminating enzyme
MTEATDHTFYAASARPVAARPALTQEIEADVCVVGGGFAGLWTAHALALRGKDVVLLEADTIANGASGRNGGFVSAGYAAELEKIIARVGLADARALYDLSRKGVESVRALISRDPAAAQMKTGRLHVTRTDDAAGLQAYGEMLSRDFGHELEFWSKGKLRRALSTTRYYQALHEKDAFHINPLMLARLLAEEIEDRGGRIYERSRVIGADINGLRKSVTTAEGRVRMFDVVLAGSAGIGEAFPWLAKTILPIRTHVVVTAPLADEMRAIRFEGAISDMRRAGDYYHLVGERLLWGGRISARRNPPRQLASVMAKDIVSVYPQLQGVPIDYAWSGVMGYAVHWMPQIGMAQPGVWVASAFGGQGLNTTAMAGEVLAAAIAEHDDRWRLFIPFGLVWNGGWAGRAAAQSIYWGMQARDRFEEARARAAERDKAARRSCAGLCGVCGPPRQKSFRPQPFRQSGHSGVRCPAASVEGRGAAGHYARPRADAAHLVGRRGDRFCREARRQRDGTDRGGNCSALADSRRACGTARERKGQPYCEAREGSGGRQGRG